ncbi:hypothetical protein G3M48_003866 [Beauveria asiatica]|uniref:Uncharacterized protein n=1 Tax=Beauveria asiatica TaxID=1069075 RepID=A0AAW0S957_9HYPO
MGTKYKGSLLRNWSIGRDEQHNGSRKTEIELTEKEKRDRAVVVSAEREEDTAGTLVLNTPPGEQNFEISENRLKYFTYKIKT